MDRPKDIFGASVIMGHWYWMMLQTGQIAGAGKFATPIGSNEMFFYINGVGYGHKFMKFVEAENPEELFIDCGPDLEAKESAYGHGRNQ